MRSSAPGNGGGIFRTALTNVAADRLRVHENLGDGIFSAGGLILRRASFRDYINHGGAKSALTVVPGPASLLVEKSTFSSNDNAVFVSRPAGQSGSVAILRLDNVTLNNNRFSSIGILDFSGGAAVQLEQSSVVEPMNVPLQGFGGRYSYAASIVVGAGQSHCASVSDPPTEFISFNNNLVGPGCPRTPSDTAIAAVADLQLSELADHGGSVLTLLPALTSPAIDRRACGNVDARDQARPVDADQNGSALCDIRAVERRVQELPGVLFGNGFE